MNGPSPHLSWNELACRDAIRTPYPLDWRSTRAVALAAAFEALRAQVGRPLVITSAYRTPAYNRQIGGAPNSQHVQGRALDIVVPNGWTAHDLGAAAQDTPGIHGVGIYPTRGFVHIDIRPAAPGQRVAVWRDGGDDEVTA